MVCVVLIVLFFSFVLYVFCLCLLSVLVRVFGVVFWLLLLWVLGVRCVAVAGFVMVVVKLCGITDYFGLFGGLCCLQVFLRSFGRCCCWFSVVG